ncbi:MAG TPA: cation:proton antiporter, partial [Terriglobales bacterium]|nr:cation:proton antiporter [Terriglobales bacterium]
MLAAVAGGVTARVLRQPLIVGFVLGGMLIGPFTPGPTVSELRTFELFAEIGVVLLMFSIGIEFSLKDLLRVKGVALLGGPLGILLTVALALGAGSLLGWPPLQAAVIGMVVSVASTMVLVQLLLDRGELHSTAGRVMIGLALVEDLAVVVMTIILPLMGAMEPGRFVAVGEALLRAAIVLVPGGYVAVKLVPRLMARVAATQSDELFLLVALSIGVGTAALVHELGLSLALGAFLAGLLISESDYAHEALARLLPLRDIFVALFFVTVGALIDPVHVLSSGPLLALIVGLVVVGKLLTRSVVVRLFGYPWAVALTTGVGLAQIGEFSFVLVQVARQAGHVAEDVYQTILMASLVTILVNAWLMRAVPDWLGALHVRGAPPPPPPTTPLPPRHVLVCGFGRVGSAIGEAFETFGIPFVVVERDPEVIRALRARGVHCLFGDAGNRELLRHAGAESATLVIIALPHFRPAERAVRTLRQLAPGVPLLARAHARTEAEALQKLGASEVIQPELEASGTLIRHALAILGTPKARALDYLGRFRGAVLTPRQADQDAAPLPIVDEVTLGDGAFADASLREARIRERFGVTVVALTRPDGVVYNPAPETILRAGDRVRVFGLEAQIDAFASSA